MMSGGVLGDMEGRRRERSEKSLSVDNFRARVVWCGKINRRRRAMMKLQGHRGALQPPDNGFGGWRFDLGALTHLGLPLQMPGHVPYGASEIGSSMRVLYSTVR